MSDSEDPDQLPGVAAVRDAEARAARSERSRVSAAVLYNDMVLYELYAALCALLQAPPPLRADDLRRLAEMEDSYFTILRRCHGE